MARPPFVTDLSFQLNGTSAGLYRLEDGGLRELRFIRDGGLPTETQLVVRRDGAENRGEGWVRVNEMGAVGERIRGFFGVSACIETETGLDCSSLVEIQGAFDVEREVDGWHLSCSVEAGAGPDAFCYASQGGLVTRLEATATNPFGYDPFLLAAYDPGRDRLSVIMAEGYLGQDDPPFAHVVSIEDGPEGTGVYL